MVYKFGSILKIIGLVALFYAVVAFFVLQSLPPNTAKSRLPSLYLQIGSVAVWLLGSAACTFGKAPAKKQLPIQDPFSPDS